MGKLITTGCSFSDHNYFQAAFKESAPDNHVWWDEYMAEELGLKLHTYSRSGAGGDRHAFDITQAVAEYGEDIKAIIVGWSIWDRFTYPYSSGTQQVCPPTIHTQPWPGHEYSSFVNVQKYSRFDLLKSCLMSTFAHMYTVSKLADSIGAKLLVFQMLAPINTHFKNTEMRDMLMAKYAPKQHEIIYQCTEENPTYKALENDKRFSGFPYLKRLGGEHLWHYHKDPNEEKKSLLKRKLVINRPINKVQWVKYEENADEKPTWGEEQTVNAEFLKDESKGFEEINKKNITVIDNHPNDKGQKHIYEKVLERWNEIYK